MIQKKKAVIIVGHGSRVQQANKEFEDFVEQFRQHVPEYEFFLAYVELAQPDLAAAIDHVASLYSEVIV